MALKLRATRPPAQGRGTKSVPRQGHNTPLPLKRSPPASFKRLLGGASLWWQRAGILRSDSDPLPNLGIRLEARRVHQDPSLHRPPRQVEETSMTVSQRLIRCFWRQADDHLGAVDAAAHVTVEEERDPPEHLLLLQPFALSKGETNSLRQLLVECHRVRLGLGALEIGCAA